MDKIRLGILGPGTIVKRVMLDLHRCEHIVLTAVASRSIEKAKAAANEYGAEYAYGSYLELAESDKVDLVYIATPNNCHAQQACLMMEHGKHVLVEKPIAMNDTEALQMVECARRNHVFFMEGMWTRFRPSIIKMRELVDSEEIGTVNHVYANFCFAGSYNPASRLYDPALGGGALLDIGIYTIMAASMFMGYNPESVMSACDKAPSGVDTRTTMTFTYAGGKTAQLHAAMDTASRCDLILLGTKGVIRATDFWCGDSFTVEKNGSALQIYDLPAENAGFRHEFDHAAKCIQAGLCESPVITHGESIKTATLMTRIRHENGIFYPGEK